MACCRRIPLIPLCLKVNYMRWKRADPRGPVVWSFELGVVNSRWRGILSGWKLGREGNNVHIPLVKQESLLGRTDYAPCATQLQNAEAGQTVPPTLIHGAQFDVDTCTSRAPCVCLACLLHLSSPSPQLLHPQPCQLCRLLPACCTRIAGVELLFLLSKSFRITSCLRQWSEVLSATCHFRIDLASLGAIRTAILCLISPSPP